LVLDEKHRLYLYRYWHYENELARSILKRMGLVIDDIDYRRFKDILKHLFPDTGAPDVPVDRQKLAVIAAVLNRFCVVSGGPGTGKTYTVVNIIAALLQLYPSEEIRIVLAAPTGKAAARMAETVSEAVPRLPCSDDIKAQIPVEASTIHRLLHPQGDGQRFRYNQENRLPADVVMVDEASMVDLALMTRLILAVPDRARIVLLGDKEQLSSVEAGSVLGDICDRQRNHLFSRDFDKVVEKLTEGPIDPSIRQSEEKSAPLNDAIILLNQNYRFDDHSGIGGLSRKLRAGRVDSIFAQLADKDEKQITWMKNIDTREFPTTLEKIIIEGYKPYLQTDDPREALNRFNRFRILCAVKFGEFGVERINRVVEKILVKHHLVKTENKAPAEGYHGRPVLITSNDYEIGLFNGDVGIVFPETGKIGAPPVVHFPGSADEPRKFPLSRLPVNETVFAMTVHKSQGSEFRDILLILPEKDYPVLTRELIYTAITRARQNVLIIGNENVMRMAITRKIERTSGLRDHLWR
jgi:exodeoxyribonuclease V alpha subunit